MPDSSCKREPVIEVPAGEVRREAEAIARIAGFRPGKAPPEPVRRRLSGRSRNRC